MLAHRALKKEGGPVAWLTRLLAERAHRINYFEEIMMCARSTRAIGVSHATHPLKRRWMECSLGQGRVLARAGWAGKNDARSTRPPGCLPKFHNFNSMPDFVRAKGRRPRRGGSRPLDISLGTGAQFFLWERRPPAFLLSIGSSIDPLCSNGDGGTSIMETQ